MKEKILFAFLLLLLLVPNSFAANTDVSGAVQYEIGQGWLSSYFDVSEAERWFTFKEESGHSYCVEVAQGSLSPTNLPAQIDIYSDEGGSTLLTSYNRTLSASNPDGVLVPAWCAARLFFFAQAYSRRYFVLVGFHLRKQHYVAIVLQLLGYNAQHRREEGVGKALYNNGYRFHRFALKAAGAVVWYVVVFVDNGKNFLARLGADIGMAVDHAGYCGNTDARQLRDVNDRQILHVGILSRNVSGNVTSLQ